MSQKRLVITEAAFRADLGACERTPERALLNQFRMMTRDRGALANDDRLDALAMAVAALAPTLSASGAQAAAAARRRRDRADAALYRDAMTSKMKGKMKSKTKGRVRGAPRASSGAARW